MSTSQLIGDWVITGLEATFPALETLSPTLFFIAFTVLALLFSQGLLLAVRGVVYWRANKLHKEDFLLARIQQPLAWLIFSGFLYIAFAALDLSATAFQLVLNLLITINLSLVAWVLSRLTTALLGAWRSAVSKRSNVLDDDAILPLFAKFVAAIIWTGAFVSILAVWGLAIGPLLAGLGLAGIAIGFAVKDSLANIFGGISLALDRAYKVGDKVRLEDGTVGVVHDISLRSTRVRTFDGDLVMVPNGKVSSDNIYTFTQPDIRSRISVDFSVAYGSKVERVREVVLKALSKIEGIEEEPAPACHFQEMGDSGLAMRANFWVPDYNQAIPKKREATTAIYNALNKAKIGIPFPTRTVYLKK